MTLTHEEFLRRFFQHVLPTGLPRIRYFGFLANRWRAGNSHSNRQSKARLANDVDHFFDMRVIQQYEVGPFPEQYL